MLNNNRNRNNKKTKNNDILSPLIIGSIFLILVTSIGSNAPNIFSQQDENVQQQESLSSFILTAKLVDNEYRWIDATNNSTNPTLNITSGADNSITIKSLEDDPEEHELTIEGIVAAGEEGEELIQSDEIEDGSSVTINFNTADLQDDSNYQSLEYYCEYHPDTMRGRYK